MEKNIFENPLFLEVEKCVDAFLLSLLWIFASLPIITIGASTTALYYTVHKVLIHERNQIWSSFWSSFKSNFKQSTILWLIILLFLFITCGDTYILYQVLNNGNIIGNFYIVFGVLAVFVVMWASYFFPYTARFQDSVKQIMMNCFKITLANIQWSLLLLILLIVAYMVTYIIPFAIIVIPTVYMLLANKVLEHVFGKYMSEEDLNKEKEFNKKHY